MQYWLLKTSKSEIPIDEDEIEKVVNALRTGSIGILKAGVFNPSFFDSIVRDYIREKGFYRDHGREISEPTSTEPLCDRFVGLREKILALYANKALK